MKSILRLVAIAAILQFFSLTGTAQQVFIANLSSAQEVPTNVSTGKGVATVTLNAAETSISVRLTYSGLTSDANMGHIHGPSPVGVNSGVQIGFTGIAGTSADININGLAITPAQVLQIRSGLAYVNIHTINFSGGEIRGQLKPANQFGDYDADGRADIGVFRGSNGTFYILNSLDNSVTSQQWGQNGDSADCIGDYDGDGRTDLAVVRDVGGNAVWYILQSLTGTLRAVQWGVTASDLSVVGDYDGDGKADVAVYRGTTSTFYVLRSSDGGLTGQQWGLAGDDPIEGDFDKDGRDDFAVIRDESGFLVWYIMQSSAGFRAVRWGITGDELLGGTRPDYDRDGKSDISVWRPTEGTFFVQQSSNGVLLAFQFGQNGDFPAAADGDGDGKADFVAFRLTNGNIVWYIWQSATNTLRSVQWGLATDQPV